MGEVLIAGMAAMLICIFLGPKFIEYLRVREFGQHIREEGPQEHHAKAGTPTMGGLIIFASILDPLYAFGSLLLILPAALLLSRGRTKWQAWEMPGY